MSTGPRLDWDPDIIAALDSDNEEPMEDDLDDDFIAMANQSGDEDDDAGPSEMSDRQKRWIEEQYLGIPSQYVLLRPCYKYTDVERFGS